MVDMWSWCVGTKTWKKAHSMTIEIKEGITLLNKNLAEQAKKLEEKITLLAQEFNAAAEQLQPSKPTPTPPFESTPEPTPPDDKVNRRPQRRGSRFGNELTLDD